MMAIDSAQPDPEVLSFLEGLRKLKLPPTETLSPDQAREALDAARLRANLPTIPLADVRELTISGPAGETRLRIYRPTQDAVLPCLIFFHGGGWVMGSLDSHDYLCRSLAALSGVVLVAVDYPLAPEAKFPRALTTGAAAVVWIHENAAKLGLDAARLAFGGDSAGANLAAVLALMARNGELPQPQLQCLIYPALDLTMSQASYDIELPGMPVNRRSMNWYIRHYLNNDSERHDWRASPLLAPNLERVAPAYILTAGFDVLRDEGEAYAQRLSDAGVPVEVRRFPGQIHPFLSLPHVLPAANIAMRDIADVLRAKLTPK